MNLKFRFSKLSNNKKVRQYHFELETDVLLYDVDETPYNRILYFYTFDDMSGFVPNFDITDPREFITLGMEILINKDYIRNKIIEEKKLMR